MGFRGAREMQNLRYARPVPMNILKTLLSKAVGTKSAEAAATPAKGVC
jgi:hypothetical protein